jgi:GAF domain-containing protein
MSQRQKNEIYAEIHSTWEHLFDDKAPWYTNLANASALLYEKLNPWWAGFYIVENDELVLGPFQGPTACTRIASGKGVCGSSWLQKKSLIVPNVHEFPGHIACSAASNSEIVIPLIRDGFVWGVLDLDSVHFSYFDEIDAKELERFCASLSLVIHP